MKRTKLLPPYDEQGRTNFPARNLTDAGEEMAQEAMGADFVENMEAPF